MVHKNGLKNVPFTFLLGWPFYYYLFIYFCWIKKTTERRKRGKAQSSWSYKEGFSREKNLRRLCKMATQIPELLSVGFSQKITDSLPLWNCLRTWNRMIPHYRNVINCSSIFIIWMWKLFYEMANNRSANCVMIETPLEIQNNFKSPLSCAKSLHGGSSGGQG